MQHRLVIEVDGEIHDDQKEHDAEREKYLRERSFTIIRFRNEEVFADLDTVLNTIEETIYTTTHVHNQDTNKYKTKTYTFPPTEIKSIPPSSSIKSIPPFSSTSDNVAPQQSTELSW